MADLHVIALRSAWAKGTEQTFDGQQMTKGMHVRWTFAPQLGFPPYGFQLWRVPGMNASNQPPITEIGSLPDPPTGTLSSPPGGWSAPSTSGWQYYTVPFTLPLATMGWPGRYAGSPDPATTSPADLAKADVDECIQRLAVENLALSDLGTGQRMSQTQMESAFGELRQKLLIDLVSAYPNSPIYGQSLTPSADDTAAPDVRKNLPLMTALMLLAQNPYMARVLGLYFVDTAATSASYTYCVVGFWGTTTCGSDVIAPGTAQPAALASGTAATGGLTITALHNASLWMGSPTQNPQVQWDPTAPADVQALQLDYWGPVPDRFLAVYSPHPASTCCQLDLPRPVSQVKVQVWGRDWHVDAYSADPAKHTQTQVASADWVYTWNPLPDPQVADLRVSLNTVPANTTLSPATAPKPAINRLVFTAKSQTTLVIGNVELHPLPDQTAIHKQVSGAYWYGQIMPPPKPIVPYLRFRRREGAVDASDPHKPALVGRSMFQLWWLKPPDQDALNTGPLAPSIPVGFIPYRQDTGTSVMTRLAPVLAVPTTVPQEIVTAVTQLPQYAKLYASWQQIIKASQGGASRPDGPGAPVSPVVGFSYLDPNVPDPAEIALPNVADDKKRYRYGVMPFDAFGVLGPPSEPSNAVGVPLAAPVPTLVRNVTFDNTAAAGGMASGSPPNDSWHGGALALEFDWSGASRVRSPDLASARVTVEGLDDQANPFTPTPLILTQMDFNSLPAAAITATKVHRIKNVTKSGETQMATLYIETTSELPVLLADDPDALLIFDLGTTQAGAPIRESYGVRTIHDGPLVVAVARVGLFPGQNGSTGTSRLVTNPSVFMGRPAYLVRGTRVPTTLAVPLAVPRDKRLAHARVYVTPSRATTFDPNETTIDPNDPAQTPRPEPASVKVAFVGPQRLPPPPPTVINEGDHVYYLPAGADGRAHVLVGGPPPPPSGPPPPPSGPPPPPSGPPIPFRPQLSDGVDHFVLLRAPMHSVFVADMKRRQTKDASGATIGPGLDNSALWDQYQANLGSPVPPARISLQEWMGYLGDWLSAYRARTPGAASLTAQTALDDAGAQRSFIEHFYGSLLDDELRALADIPANRSGFAQASLNRFPPNAAPGTYLLVDDAIDGRGFGRVLYKMYAVSTAGTRSDQGDLVLPQPAWAALQQVPATPSAGPFYTRVVTPPRPPVLYKVQAARGALIVAWSLDDNPDIAAYLIYRSAHESDLKDLRYFGKDPLNPAPSDQLARLLYQHWRSPGMGLVRPSSPPSDNSDIDPRLIGLVPDLRLFARDYPPPGYQNKGSDLAEVTLPAGTDVPASAADIVGVYRLSEFNASPQATGQPQAFDYWRYGSGDHYTCDYSAPSGTAGRLVGLRVGIGRGVPVVVVGTVKGATKVYGTLPVRRAAFIDGAAGPAAIDPNALPTWSPPSTSALNYYAVVAVDIHGNRSAPSTVYAGTPLSALSV